MRRIDDTPLIGKRYGKWTVTGIGHKTIKRSHLSCVCECGAKLDVLRETLFSGASTGCRKCSGKFGNTNPAWRGYKDVPQQFFYIMKKGAAARDIECNLTIEDLQDLWDKHGGRCALTGQQIVLATKKTGCTASVDRIDGSRGYAVDNVQFVHKDINLMKNKFKEDYFVNLCRLVVEHAA